MIMMRDMGYNPKALVYNAVEAIREAGVKWPECNKQVNEAILRAWKKAGLADDPDLANRMEDEPRAFIHEFEHLILDPSFSLGEGGSSAKHSKVESAMEEAFSWGLAGDISEEAIGSVVSDAWNWLGLSKDMVVKDLLDKLGQAPISNPDRKKIRDSVVRDLRKTFQARAGDLIENEIGPELGKQLDHRQGYSLSGAVLWEFFTKVAAKYDDVKQVLSKDQEEAWRKFNLHLKNEIKKIAPQADALYPGEREQKSKGD